MTFRGRLRLFFAIIVIVPMIAIGFVLFELTGDSERGKEDAALATALNVAFAAYADGRADARAVLPRLASDRDLTAALRRGDRGATARRLRRLVASSGEVVSATLASPGQRPIRAGSDRGVADAGARLTGAPGAPLGRLTVSVTDARELARTVRRATGRDISVIRAGRTLASSDPAVSSIPGDGSFDSGGSEYRGRRDRAGTGSGGREELAVFTKADDLNATVSDNRLIVAAVLLAFLALALASSILVVRGLHAQIDQLLEAARGLVSGNFGGRVRTEGNDEFAQLGREFNSMSDQLEAKVGEVERKREELEETIRRVGKAFTTGLDQQGIVDLTVQTAVDACGAEYGRALPLDSRILDETQAGHPRPELLVATEAAERAVFAVGPHTGAELLQDLEDDGGRPTQREPVSASQGGAHAVGLQLRARLGPHNTSQYVGVISIARSDREFTQQEKGLLEYLAAQAVVSIENADLHETVRHQALTDELTGLSNVREMYGALDRELERGRRFDTPIGFVLLDIDDFKLINDTYGHQQGDEVLTQVANVLRRLSRDIDEPARYGGEELAVVLPQTDIEGGAMLAERMRAAVDEIRIPTLDGEGDIRVTASFGVASMPSSASDRNSLVAAADAALYRAKRAGKNRVERADPVVSRG